MFMKTLITLILLLHSSSADMLKKGEKIYSIMCDKEKISALSSTDTAALKKQIQQENICGNLNAKKLDALLLFITSDTKTTTTKALSVPDKARCPVCGMFTAKYPKWVAIIKSESGKKHYFDGVKDMMKFYFDPVQFHHKKEAIASIKVSDYYTLEGIDAKKAYYVIGSNIYGPMGEELIPFKNSDDAAHFRKEHHGKKVITFDTIEEKFLY